MSKPIETLPRTSIAVVSWVDGDTTYARLYTQDTNGGIRESRYDGKSWNVGTVIATAKANSPISACLTQINWIKVFYLTTDNIVNAVESTDRDTWRVDQNSNDANIQTSPASRLAVIATDITLRQGIHFILYYQKPDGSIGCQTSNNGFFEPSGSFGEQALAGTGLAATNVESKDQDGDYQAIRIFYQVPDGALTYVDVDRNLKSFKPGDVVPKTQGSVPPHTNLSVISNGSVERHAFQVYSAYLQGNNAVVAEWGYYSGTWKHANPAPIPLANDSGIAVFYDIKAVPTPLFKVYAQHETHQILEFTAENQWGPWKISAIVPV